MEKLSINYHDSYLVSISTEIENDSLELMFTDGKSHSTIRFLNVKRSLVNSFTIGNIVLGIELYSGESLNDQVVKHPSFESLFSPDRERSYFNKIVAGIREGSLVYISVSSSYGCTADIICERIEEIPPKEWDPWRNALW